MWLETIELSGFRNYQETALTFSDGVNVFLGQNAQGKTNMMESIYFLALARSHRTTSDKELINWEADFTRVSGKINSKGSTFPLAISLSNKGKQAKVNHLEQKKLSQYVGHLNIILFAPEDLELVKGSPAVRRQFIDRELGQMSAVYLHHLVSYQEILKQRNQYLKEYKASQSFDLVYLDILTEQLATEGAEVLERRLNFTEKLNEWAAPIQQDISQGKEKLDIQYKTTLSLSNDSQKSSIYRQLLDKYEESKQRELDRGTTIIGPHRDDLVFYVNDKNIQTYGSQGQQRTTALSVKLAEIELMKEMTGEYPVLLLDDVLSELDNRRQTHLLKTIEKKVQTFLTTTSLDGVDINLLNEPKIFHVSAGQIVKKEVDSEEMESA